MKAGNFEALLCTDPIFTASKFLNPLKKYNKNQEASYNFKLDFALSNRPHFNSVYLVRVPILTGIFIPLFHRIFILFMRCKAQAFILLESCFKASVAPGKKVRPKQLHVDPYKQGATLGIGLYSRFQRARLLNRAYSNVEFKLEPMYYLLI